MPDNILAITVRERVRREVPMGRGKTRGRTGPKPLPGEEGNKERKLPHSPSFDLPGPEVDLVKVAPGGGHRR